MGIVLPDRFRRTEGWLRLPALLLPAVGFATIVAAVSVSKAAAQGGLAALPMEVPAPADNATTPERVTLGRLLFWDPVLSGPYMHNGVFATLQDVVDFYRRVRRGGGRRGGRGGGGGLNPAVNREAIDPLATQLNMRGRGQGDLIAFLRALDDPEFDRTIPERVPSGLPVGGR